MPTVASSDPHSSQASSLVPKEALMDLGKAFCDTGDVASPAMFFDDKYDVITELPRIERKIRQLNHLPTYRYISEDVFTASEISKGPQKGTPIWTIKKGSRLEETHDMASTLLSLNTSHNRFSTHAEKFLEHLGRIAQDSHTLRGKVFLRNEKDEFLADFEARLTSFSKTISSAKFKREAKEAEANAKKQKTSIGSWFYQIFHRTPRVLWIQMQLSSDIPRRCNVATVLRHRQTFLDKRHKDNAFRHLVGYLSKVNYVPDKGVVNDIILLYDAQKVSERVSLTHALARLWHETTEQKGTAWIESETPIPDHPKMNGIWTLRSQKSQKRLDQVIHYLSHYDTYISPKVTKRTRTMTKSKAPDTLRRKKNHSIKRDD